MWCTELGYPSREAPKRRFEGLEESVYTDASVMPHLRSSAIAVYFKKNKKRNITAPIEWNPDPTYCEMVAITRAISKIAESVARRTLYYIYTDSLKSVRQFHAHFRKKEVTHPEFWSSERSRDIDENVKKIHAKGSRVRLHWIKGHAKVKGNLVVDTMARDTAMRNAEPFAGYFKAMQEARTASSINKAETKAPLATRLSAAAMPAAPVPVAPMPAAPVPVPVGSYAATPSVGEKRKERSYEPTIKASPVKFQASFKSRLPQIRITPDLPTLPLSLAFKCLDELPPTHKQQGRSNILQKDRALNARLARYPKKWRHRMRLEFFERQRELSAKTAVTAPPRAEVNLTEPATVPAQARAHPIYEPRHELASRGKRQRDTDEPEPKRVALERAVKTEPKGVPESPPGLFTGDSAASSNDDCEVVLPKGSNELLNSDEIKSLLDRGYNDKQIMAIVSAASRRVLLQWQKKQKDSAGTVRNGNGTKKESTR